MSSRSNPFDEIERMLERMSRQFDANIADVATGGEVAVDVEDRDDEYVVTADLPGYDREDLVVEATDDSLTVGATHAEEAETQEGEYLRQERSTRSVRRTVSLPGPIEEDEASATYSNGVLTVTLPKRTGSGGGHSIEVE